MELVVVAAVAENGVIGDDGAMPWHHPADLKRFKRTTMGHPVIMGRVTYESIEERLGGPLPGRTNVVLSRGDPDVPAEVLVVGTPAEAVETARSIDDERAFVIGGATVYEAFLPLADRLLITEVHAEPEGDTTFPEWDVDAWTEVSREDRGEFSFVAYERARGVGDGIVGERES